MPNRYAGITGLVAKDDKRYKQRGQAKKRFFGVCVEADITPGG
jgi:hypothetical protein